MLTKLNQSPSHINLHYLLGNKLAFLGTAVHVLHWIIKANFSTPFLFQELTLY